MRTLQWSFTAGVVAAVALGLATRTGDAQVLTDVSDIKISRGGSDVECQVVLPHGTADTLVVTSIRVDTGVNTWVSLDAGLTWRKLASVVSGSVDPIVAASPHVTDGRLLLSHLEQTGAVSVEYRGLGSAGLDSTTAFTHVTVQAPEVPAGAEIERGWDKNFIWVDRRPSGTYAQRVYCGYSDSESGGDPDLSLERVHLKYSTNHGASGSWSARKDIDLATSDTRIHVGVALATAPDAARVYAAWAAREASEAQPAKAIWFRYSTTGGDTWTAPSGGAAIMNVQGFGRHSLTGKSMRTTASPSMTVAGDGDIYLVFADKESGHTDTDIYILKSEDGGATWKMPGGSGVGYKRVNAGGSGTANMDQWFPWITWDDSTNSLVVVYYDSRDNTSNVQTYVSVSHNEGLDWSDLRVSDTGWDGDPPTSEGFGDAWAGDYIGVAAASGLAFPVWADDRVESHSYRLYTSPVLVGGIDTSTITPIVGQNCAGIGNPRVRFEVDWQTLVAMDGTDKLTVTPPGGSPQVVSTASTGTSHTLVVYDLPCVNGTWKYVIESNKGAATSSKSDSLPSVTCISCPPPCNPPCELD